MHHDVSDSILPIRETERRNPRTVNIDLASPLGIVQMMNDEDRTVAEVVAACSIAIAQAVETAETAFRAGGRLLYAGAGTSGRLGVLDASECPPTFGTDPRMVVGIIAGGDTALRNSVEGAEDVASDGAAAMEANDVNAKDFFVGIAASGTTPYVQGALRRAQQLGAKTALVACSSPPPAMLAHVDIAIVAIVGPEVVTGSTRLKAGTATKMILNMITTGAMIRIGKTWGNLMVDVRTSNVKLKHRAQKMVMDVCHVNAETADNLLLGADGQVKLAIVMQSLDIGAAEARLRIADARGVIRNVLSSAPPPVT
ncbi:MAG: N-acetylmuramic acid 6-phosphate etherase [Gemmatimonadota bacterium]|nr:N-acetylmuramic acid 6-phosphate etherase [Gemmatimonadota bacterium]